MSVAGVWIIVWAALLAGGCSLIAATALAERLMDRPKKEQR